jgi:uncharacterized C2H2 Zn-finger protein
VSTFAQIDVTCPSCESVAKQTVAHSIHGPRLPDVVEAIIDGSFQRVQCPSCDSVFQMDAYIRSHTAANGKATRWQHVKTRSLPTNLGPLGSGSLRSTQLFMRRNNLKMGNCFAPRSSHIRLFLSYFRYR